MDVLYHARDVHAALETDPACSQSIDLRCVILRRNKRGSRLYLDLQDESAAVQAIMKKEGVTEEAWENGCNRRPGDAVSLLGYVTGDFPEAKIIASTVELHRDQVPTPELGKPTPTMGLGSPVTQAYIARLQKVIREWFEDDGQIEITTRLISSISPPPGLHPLQVLYQGFGAPFYITPSPAPQLIRALSSTSYKKVFTVSRCFTQVYRDPIASVESVIITSAQRNISISKALSNADGMIRKLLLLPATRTAHTSIWPITTIVNFGVLDHVGSAAVESPEIQLFKPNDMKGIVSEIGRLCWPMSRDFDMEFAEYVLAEGYTAGTAGVPAYTVFSINIDRLLMLLFEQVDLRRIPTLDFRTE